MSDDEYREFEEALTDVLTETAYSLRRRNPIGERTRSRRPARPSLYIEAVNRAFLMVLNQGLRQMGLTKAPLVQRPSLAIDADASRHIFKEMPAFIDPTGKKFGRLTVTRYDGAIVHGEARRRCERP